MEFQRKFCVKCLVFSLFHGLLNVNLSLLVVGVDKVRRQIGVYRIVVKPDVVYKFVYNKSVTQNYGFTSKFWSDFSKFLPREKWLIVCSLLHFTFLKSSFRWYILVSKKDSLIKYYFLLKSWISCQDLWDWKDEKFTNISVCIKSYFTQPEVFQGTKPRFSVSLLHQT